MNDPIVDEVRKVRDAHAARFHYDLDAIFRDIKEQENKSGRTFVSFPPRKLEPPQALQSTGPPFRLLRRQWLPRRLRRLTVAPAYWETLSATLADRDKIIIDADKVPGGRNLWLLPFPPSGFPMSGMVPAPRPQTPDPRGET